MARRRPAAFAATPGAVFVAVLALVALPSVPGAAGAAAASSVTGCPNWSHGYGPPLGSTWTNLTTKAGAGPGVRNGSASADDVTGGAVVVFGGLAPNGTVLGDTWSYRAGHWTQVNTTGRPHPSPRAFASMVFDQRDGELILFGGVSSWPPSNAAKLNDTWAYQNGTWRLLHPAVAPMARYAASMAWDAASHYVLLFGGNTTLGPYADTWTFVAGHWTRIRGTQPNPRVGAAMTYDDACHSVVLATGLGLGSHGLRYQNETWSYSAGTWSFVFFVSFVPKPLLRFGAAFATSPVAGINETILAGGSPCGSGSCAPRGWARTSGEYYNAFFYYGLPHWTSDSPQTPVTRSNTEFPVFVYDFADGYFLYFVDGQTWTFR